jgi:hypothetical protein
MRRDPLLLKQAPHPLQLGIPPESLQQETIFQGPESNRSRAALLVGVMRDVVQISGRAGCANGLRRDGGVVFQDFQGDGPDGRVEVVVVGRGGVAAGEAAVVRDEAVVRELVQVKRGEAV